MYLVEDKTIKLSDLICIVNDFNLNSADELKVAREHMSNMLSTLLMDNNVYNGFTYLDQDQMKKSKQGTTCGIYFHNGNWIFTGTDKSRVRY